MKYTLEPESPWPRRYSTCVGNRMTTIQIAVLQQALEALEEIEWSNDSQWQSDRAKVAITALRAALAQQAEPVQLRELLIQAASMAVAAERAGKYGGASWVADAVLEDCPKQQAEQEPVEPAAESTYHPCTFILIEGLKKLKAWDVLAEWDKAREIVDKRFHAALAQQDEPRNQCGETCERAKLCAACAQALAQQDEPVAWIDALKDAFFEGFTSVATYNDTLLNSPEEAWENYKPPYTAPPQRKPLTKEKIMRAFYAVKKTP